MNNRQSTTLHLPWTDKSVQIIWTKISRWELAFNKVITYSKLMGSSFFSYHAVVNTSNGVESHNKFQEKTLHYPDWLQCFMKASIKPAMHIQCTCTYFWTTTSNNIFEFMDSPQQVIFQSLERKTNSRKYDRSNILCENEMQSIFTIKGS